MKTGPVTQIDEVRSGRSYQSDFGRRLHFGLGAASTVDEITVQWPGGARETIRNVASDRVMVLVEGSMGADVPAKKPAGSR